jgi:predicted O-methyltransferase YrrM
MNYLYRVYYFLIHILTARHTKGFGVHSPFLFDFTRYVILEKNAFYKFDEIEKTRSKLLNNYSVIDIEDFGTAQKKQRKISDIAQKSLIRPKYGRLVFRTINYLKLNNLLELGTSLGISTAYIASTSEKSTCITLEGCKNTAALAVKTFESLKLKNIELITGNIDITLVSALNKLSEVDFVYVDANHSEKATIAYFDTIVPYLSKNAAIIFDDIYWSKGMKNAWKNIISRKEVTSSIDLFQVGVVFFKPELNKKHYKMIF